ncbi:MAG: fasciclin domain-containing protein [Chitinophagaceae bacterium]|nr:fasciclin domain-containing protein [Chitinophagaceae bacterium]
MIRNIYLRIGWVVILSLALMASCGKKEVVVDLTKQPQTDLLRYIQNNFTFSCFYEALAKTGLDKMLAEKDSLTVLVPDDDAFKRIGINSPEGIDKLNTDSLKKAISFYILPQTILYDEIPLAVDNEYKNLAGDILYFSKPLPREYPDERNKGHVNGAAFKFVDLKNKNGVVHVLDRTLKPPAPSVKAFLDTDTTYSYFVAALKKFGLYDQLDKEGPFTVMAVPNEAFRSLNISLDSIARLDTVQFKKYLFGVYVFYPNRLFFSDFQDAPGKKNGFNGIGNYLYSVDGYLYFATYDGGMMLALGYAKDFGTPYDPSLGPGFNGPAHFYSYDNLAVNGVVHGINKLVIYPNEMKK